MTDLISTKGTSCSETPVNAELDFSWSRIFPGNITRVSVDNQIDMNGYVGSASLYNSEICILGSCRFEQIYAVTDVTEDNYLYGYSGAYGVLGLGIASPFWL
jgi:hypothetical protein